MFFLIWLLIKKYVMFALMLGIMSIQISSWEKGEREAEQSVKLLMPATNTELIIYAKRSNPIQPEFDRRLEIRTDRQPAQIHELTGDTSGANIVDLYVKSEGPNLHLYLTSPFFYEQDKRMEPVSTAPYPDVGDEPSTSSIARFEQFAKDNPGVKIDPVQMAQSFPVQKFWVLYDGVVPLADPEADSAFKNLTRLGHFDTRYMKWIPSDSPSKAGN